MVDSTARRIPEQEEVVTASRIILDEVPGLGIAKLLARLQAEQAWSLSEKRLKTILQQANMRPTSNSAATGHAKGNGVHATPEHVPRSRLDRGLPLPADVEAVYFDPIKGKGLVAKRAFQEGETILTEDAFIAAPPSQAMQQVDRGELCTHCFAPLAGALTVRCGQKDCEARFCTRLCQSRAQSAHHALLCPGQNPSIKPFRRFLAAQRWLSLAIVSKTLARILLTHSQHAPATLLTSSSNARSTEEAKATLQEMLDHFDAFATVSELERRARNPGWDVERTAFLQSMQQAHQLLVEGMDPRRPRKGKWPLSAHFPVDVAERLFSWDAFVLMLGRANINTEAQGGMYLVHSHLNHSCAPNVTIRHPPSRHGVRQATKVAALAKRPIAKGEELTITYQDPSIPLARRRMLLWREYMFGPCVCSRCQEELEALDQAERTQMEQGAWMHDEKEQEEVQRRKEHAQMLDQLDQDRRQKLAAEGKATDQGDQDLQGVEEEIRTHLGF